MTYSRGLQQLALLEVLSSENVVIVGHPMEFPLLAMRGWPTCDGDIVTVTQLHEGTILRRPGAAVSRDALRIAWAGDHPADVTLGDGDPIFGPRAAWARARTEAVLAKIGSMEILDRLSSLVRYSPVPSALSIDVAGDPVIDMPAAMSADERDFMRAYHASANACAPNGVLRLPNLGAGAVLTFAPGSVLREDPLMGQGFSIRRQEEHVFHVLPEADTATFAARLRPGRSCLTHVGVIVPFGTGPNAVDHSERREAV